MRVARSQLLRAPPPVVRHRPLAETALHRAPAKLHKQVLPHSLLAGVTAHALQHSRRPSGLQPATTWLDAGATPRTPIERAVRHIEAVVQPPADCAGCEWWVQRLLPGGRTNIALHWDKDECEASQKKYLTHPSLASVFYLSDAGGPTIVLPMRVPSPEQQGRDVVPPGSDAFACFPAENRLLTFQGDLLHGVLDEPWPIDGARLTLLVNWWADKPQAPCCDRAATPGGGFGSESESAPPCDVGPGAAAEASPTELLASRLYVGECDDEREDALTHCSLQLPGVAGGGRLCLRLPWDARGRGGGVFSATELGEQEVPQAGAFLKWAFDQPSGERPGDEEDRTAAS